nr:hypothetical protein AVEN_31593-1 [Araneus ventricosus]
MMSKSDANYFPDTKTPPEVCVHYPIAVNVFHTANRFSDILSLMTCPTKNWMCAPDYNGFRDLNSPIPKPRLYHKTTIYEQEAKPRHCNLASTAAI